MLNITQLIGFGVAKAPPVQTLVGQAVGTIIGDMTDANPNNSFNGIVDTGVNSARNVDGVDNSVTPKIGGHVGKDWGAGNTKTISGVHFYGPSNESINNSTLGSTITIELQGSTDNFSSSIVSLGSFSFTDSASSANGQQLTGFTTTTAYRYHRVVIKSSGTFSGGGCRCGELYFYEDI